MSNSSSSSTSSVDTALLQTNLNGALVVNLSALVQQIPDLIKVQTSDSMSTVISFRALRKEFTSFYVPGLNLAKFYDLGKFNANYLQAFGASFPPTVTCQLFPGLDISVVNNLNFSSEKFLDLPELAAFRFLTCLSFGLVFNLTLGVNCACFPKTLNELSALSAGIGINCVSLTCRNQLKNNPLLFSDLLHTDCENVNFNAAFVSLDVFAGQNLNINLDIIQTDDQANMTTALVNSVNSLTASVNVLQDQFSGFSSLYTSDRRNVVDAVRTAQVFVGSILPWPAGAKNIPAGYLLCDGRPYHSADFPDLFAIIGTAYNASADTIPEGQFQVPDLRGSLMYGGDASHAPVQLQTSAAAAVSAQPLLTAQPNFFIIKAIKTTPVL